MSNRKTEFWWASIHGADPEPVEKTEIDGRPCVYTLGCADPFYLDDVPCAVMFLPKTDYSNAHQRMERPKLPSQMKADADLMALAADKGHKSYITSRGEKEAVRGWSRGHGWRGPR